MTRQPPGSESTLETLWMSVADELKELAPEGSINPAHSIRHQLRSISSASLESVAQRLPRLVVQREADQVDLGDLVLGRMLGEGSMGRVYQANQTSLHREVAVKTVAPNKDPRKMTEVLFRETWVTGWLEHPNIVPVHLLGTDAEGHPVLVMKQIEGVLWSDLLADPALLADAKEDQQSDLVWHIQALIQVCHAVEFAHSRGIIHRDLKPSNVMIGEFGEIYALDWGLALQVEAPDDGRARPPIPKASEVSGIAGTPAYMAPEMALGEGDLLSYQTDIYLLGAILHEIILGEPPHSGDDLKELLRSALLSEPYPYEASVPQELREICHKAMANESEERYSDVKSFRRALQSFLQHQESYRLSRNTLAPLNELCAIPATPMATTDKGPGSGAALIQIYERFGRCHFGLQRALELWSDNGEARDSMQRILEWMIQFEIAQGQIDSAARWLKELPTANEACAQALDEARHRQAQEQARLERLQQIQGEVDLSSSRELRRKAAFVMALVWFVVSAIGYTMAVTRTVDPDHVHLLACNLLFAVAVAVTVVVGRKLLLTNHANRQLVLLFALFCSMIILARLSFMILDVDFRKSIFLEYITFIHFVGMMGILYNKRILLAAALYIVAMISSYFTPGDHIYIVMALTHPTCLVIVSWFWTEPEHQDLAFSGDIEQGTSR